MKKHHQASFKLPRWLSLPLIVLLLASGMVTIETAVAPAPAHATTVNYYLPYTAGFTAVMTQGPGGSTSHTGTNAHAYDFDLNGGAVRASAPGTIVGKVANQTGQTGPGNSGNYVVIKHADNTCTSYVHMAYGSVTTKNVGDPVAQAEQIGSEGNTGYTLPVGGGHHLHFQRDNCSWNSMPVDFVENSWTSQNTPPTSGGIHSAITAARNADGRIELFALGTDNNIYGKSQTVPNGGFNANWYTLLAGAKDLVAVSNADGRIELLYVATDGAIYGRSQTVINGGFGQEYTLGGNLSRLTAARNADGRIELLAVGTDGNIYGKSQTVPNGGFNAGWYMLPAGAKDVAAVSNADGRIELLYVGSNGGIFGRSQMVINGGFGSEYTIGGNLSKVTAARNADGRIEAFAVGTDGNLFGKAQSQVNGGFNPNWYTLSAGARDVAAVSNADGRIELLYVANGGAVYGRSQTVVNGGFGQEYILGGNFM